MYALRAQVKALAAESRILRQEERRNLRGARWWRKKADVAGDVDLTVLPQFRACEKGRAHMHHKRTAYLRSTTRAALLAYGFLRGRPYRTMEGDDTRKRPDWDAVVRIIRVFSEEDSRILRQRFSAWVDAAALPYNQRPKSSAFERFGRVQGPAPI